MKRLILSVLAVFAIAAAVVGCGSSNTAGPTPTPTSTPTSTATPTPTSTHIPSSGNTELQGTWSRSVAGLISTFTFSGNNWTLTETATSTTGVQMSGTFTIDSTVNPKTIDLYTTAFPAAPQMVGTTSLGIYLLSGTNLKLEMGDSGAARPTEFTEDYSITLVKK